MKVLCASYYRRLLAAVNNTVVRRHYLSQNQQCDDFSDPESLPLVQREQWQHAVNVNRSGAELLFNTRLLPSSKSNNVNRKKKTVVRKTLWDHIQNYKSSYSEKTVLIDPLAAGQISQAIEKYSQSGPDTSFVDADGGLCLVTKAIIERGCFAKRPYTIFERDVEWKKAQVLDKQSDKVVVVKVHQLNLAKFWVEYLLYLGDYVSPLSTCGLGETDWNDERPNFTLYGTATRGVVKYFTHKCLQKWDNNNVDHVLGEFNGGRPEFFFLVAPRTWTHVSCCQVRQMFNRPLNVLFQILFDFKLATKVPRKAFLPWKRSKYSSNSIFTGLEDDMYLIWARPKRDIGLLQHENFRSHHLEFFVHALFRHNYQRIVPTVERWVPGAGLDLVRSGITVYTLIKDIKPEQVVPLFNMLLKQKHYSVSNFVAQADSFVKTKFQDREPSAYESLLYLDKFRKGLH